MLRPLAVLAVFAFCAFTGMRASTALKRRYDAVRGMQNAIRRLAMSMEYSARPLMELIETCRAPDTEVFFEAFCEALCAHCVLDAWKRAMAHAQKRDVRFAALKTEELNLMEEYARSLGASDKVSQLKNAKLVNERLEEVAAYCAAEYARKGRVYRSMGVLCGVAAAILLW